MKIQFTFFITCMFLILKSVYSQTPIEPTWYPYWPFSMDTGIDEVHIGYGEWCTIATGPHLQKDKIVLSPPPATVYNHNQS